MSTNQFRVDITNKNISDIHITIPKDVEVESIILEVGTSIIYEIKNKCLQQLIKTAVDGKVSIMKPFISYFIFELSFYHIARIIITTTHGDPCSILVEITKDDTIHEAQTHTIKYVEHIINYKRPVYSGDSYTLKPTTLRFGCGFAGVV